MLPNPLTDANGGTGQRLGHVAIILAGVSALVGTLVTLVSISVQSKNYRKPLLQRYVIRILVMVPIYCIASFASLVSLKVAFWIDPFRDVYEAFTIYAFTQLLINFIGGERSLIIMMHGRPPVSHLWPLNHCLPKVDISDPHTFLGIKRGILQYAWIKPLLALATIIMKATGTFQEGYIGVTSGYFWSSLIYNISICVCLYALALFWVCMSADLQPFRPMPKFLGIKGIIFASYWQGLFLSILVWLGAIPDSVPGYTPDNLAASIQDALICFEMPFFALFHWYAFSWHDYADITISAARMPVKYALRDAFGPVDLIQDAKETLQGTHYGYRYFDARDDVLAHEESAQRAARIREGMRFSRDGKGKYWIPNPHEINSKTPLLNAVTSHEDPPARPSNGEGSFDPETTSYGTSRGGGYDELTDNPQLDESDEELFQSARALEFGDWKYPVITAHNATREDHLYREPGMITSSTNRHLLQSTKENRARRKSRIEQIQKDTAKGKHRRPSLSPVNSGDEEDDEDLPHPNDSAIDDTPVDDSHHRGRLAELASHIPIVSSLTAPRAPSSHSNKSQLVDLVVEDTEAEQIERVRARKEGSPGWNRHDPRHYIRAYGDEITEEVREGFEPPGPPTKMAGNQHTLDASGEDVAVTEDETGGEKGGRDNEGVHVNLEAREGDQQGKVDFDARGRRFKMRDYTEEEDAREEIIDTERENGDEGSEKPDKKETFGEEERNPWMDGDGR